MPKKSSLILCMLVIILAGCTVNTTTAVPALIASDTPTLEFNQPTPVPLASPTTGQMTGTLESPTPTDVDQQVVLNKAFEVIKLLKEREMAEVSQYVHPQTGLRFTPYSYIKDSDQVFAADQVAGLMENTTVYQWGNYDGTGEPINLTFPDYYAKFVYDVDFIDAPQLALNHRLGTGNTLDNSQDFYPGAMIVEFHFPGFDPQYGGMDWRSLRLVFMQADQTWYLAGIIHDQWTI